MLHIELKDSSADEQFIHKILPRLFTSRILKDYQRNYLKYQPLVQYLHDIYGLELSEVLQVCCRNYRWYRLFDGSLVFAPREETLYKGVKLSLLTRLIDDGALQVRGAHVFSQTAQVIQENLRRYHRLYFFTKGNTKLWQ